MEQGSYDKYSFWLVCHIITCGFFIYVANLAGNGNLSSDLSEFHSEKVVFLLFLILGYLQTQRILKSAKKFDVVNVLLSILYFYYGFSFFVYASHGHDSIFEKILIGFFNSLILLFSVETMWSVLKVALAHFAIIKTIWLFHLYLASTFIEKGN